MVIRRVTYQCDALMIFCRGADKGHASNVNVLNGVGISDSGFGDRFFKWIEVDRDQIDVVPAKIERLFMVFFGGAGEESAMDRGVQRFDSATQDLWRPGIFCDLG